MSELYKMAVCTNLSQLELTAMESVLIQIQKQKCKILDEDYSLRFEEKLRILFPQPEIRIEFLGVSKRLYHLPCYTKLPKKEFCPLDLGVVKAKLTIPGKEEIFVEGLMTEGIMMYSVIWGLMTKGDSCLSFFHLYKIYHTIRQLE